MATEGRGGTEEGGEWGWASCTLTQQNLVGHLNRVIFNCLTAAACVPRHSQYLSLLFPSSLFLLLRFSFSTLFFCFFLCRHLLLPSSHTFLISRLPQTLPLFLFFPTSYYNKGTQFYRLFPLLSFFSLFNIPAPPSSNSSCDNYMSSVTAVFFLRQIDIAALLTRDSGGFDIHQI